MNESVTEKMYGPSDFKDLSKNVIKFDGLKTLKALGIAPKSLERLMDKNLQTVVVQSDNAIEQIIKEPKLEEGYTAANDFVSENKIEETNNTIVSEEANKVELDVPTMEPVVTQEKTVVLENPVAEPTLEQPQVEPTEVQMPITETATQEETPVLENPVAEPLVEQPQVEPTEVQVPITETATQEETVVLENPVAEPTLEKPQVEPTEVQVPITETATQEENVVLENPVAEPTIEQSKNNNQLIDDAMQAIKIIYNEALEKSLNIFMVLKEELSKTNDLIDSEKLMREFDLELDNANKMIDEATQNSVMSFSKEVTLPTIEEPQPEMGNVM